MINFGSKSLYHRIFPNKLSQKNPLVDKFDYRGKEKIKDLLLMANRILVNLGVGYFHQIYRRAFYFELKTANVNFDIVKEIQANYRKQSIGSQKVNFFIIGNLPLSVIAVKELDKLILSRFCNHIRYLKCKRGLIFNFNSVCLDFKYFELC